ncbi:MAG: hypothetical protein K2W95_10810 [Candidatus Obscuribacterales bacterium]|nr:hypothetical protein [Candidatus Obscuribacterales bacterium]
MLTEEGKDEAPLPAPTPGKPFPMFAPVILLIMLLRPAFGKPPPINPARPLPAPPPMAPAMVPESVFDNVFETLLFMMPARPFESPLPPPRPPPPGFPRP